MTPSRALVLRLVIAAPIVALCAPAAAQEPGWRELELGGDARATRYLPSSVRACDALPLLLFLHGAGGTPEAYHSHLQAAAETHGLVLLLPQASGAGWSGADTGTINAALGAVAAELTIDVTRTYIGGHSAGGAFAYLLGYGSMGFAAIFSMSAPFYMVGSVADPAHRAPIRMYYGADDANYTGGSAAALEAQWTRLGVAFETDVQVGFGHSTWPPSSIAAGLASLLARRYPGAPTASTCAGADAGTTVDASTSLDAGATADASPRDASTRDAATPRGSAVASGCGCRATGRAPDSAAWALLLSAVVAARVRRRVRRSPRDSARRAARS